MITVGYKRGECLRVIGHAGYAEKGQDIVCAGISALYCALRTVSRETRETEENMPGYVGQEVRTLYPRYDRVTWTVAARVIADGMRMIAEQYPENVKYLEGYRETTPQPGQSSTSSVACGDSFPSRGSL